MKQRVKAEVMLEFIDILSEKRISDKAGIWEDFESRVDHIMEMKTSTNRLFSEQVPNMTLLEHRGGM